MTTTFVTALFKIYDATCINGKTLEKRLEWFNHIAKCNIPIYLCIDEESATTIRPSFDGFTNIYWKIMPSFKETWTFRKCEEFREKLPCERNVEKDTFEYLALMNAKTEFINLAISDDIFHTKQFAWIDFNVFHIIKNIEATSANIVHISQNLLANDCVIFPGCWDAGTCARSLWTRINWRFCGGFFIGTMDSLRNMHTLIEAGLSEILRRHGGLTWEVNLWSELENTTSWRPRWYKADHNDSILQIPNAFFTFG